MPTFFLALFPMGLGDAAWLENLALGVDDEYDIIFKPGKTIREN